MSDFTPGPWSRHLSHIYAPDGAIIAQVHNPGSRAEHYPLVANATLMTAAPELLEAVRLLLASHRPGVGQCCKAADAGIAAIAKASEGNHP